MYVAFRHVNDGNLRDATLNQRLAVYQVYLLVAEPTHTRLPSGT